MSKIISVYREDTEGEEIGLKQNIFYLNTEYILLAHKVRWEWKFLGKNNRQQYKMEKV